MPTLLNVGGDANFTTDPAGTRVEILPEPIANDWANRPGRTYIPTE